MISNVFAVILALGVGSLSRQADALLTYVVEDSLSRHETRVGLDYSGGVWLLDNYQGKVQVTRIKPNGKSDPEKVDVFEASKAQLGQQVVFDDYNTLCFVLAGGERIADASPLFLFQVTSEGKVRSYDPWPLVPFKRNYLERLAADTLLIMGGHVIGEIPISKGIMTEEGILPAFDTIYYMEDISLLNIGSQRDYYRTYIDWDKDWGLRADIQWYTSHEDVGPDKLSLTALSLGGEDSFSVRFLGTYPWRNYIWRTFRNAWMRYLTFVPYREGGYILAVSDPRDRSITHLVRLSEDGEPIDPATLEKGGEFSPRPFRRLPDQAESHVDISMWGRIEQVPDSAHVIFWGCDDKGNMYTYRRLWVNDKD
ncbi:hypothetical protein JXM67_09750 [candidate division WOR-3 bacterium]|nr:hypothetical protein [candidate division WOR-3 bacterium]